MIAHSVSLTVQVRDLSAARTALEALLARHHGYAAQLTANTAENSPRRLQSSLRVPDAELAAAIAEMRALGHVETETQSGDEVTQQHADLVARLENSRETEQRLRAILEQRTGKIEDVLQVEEEIARVRGEIEQMEADQKVLEHRVDFATIELQLAEQYREQLGPQSASVPMQIRNAFVAGLRHGASTLLGILLFLEEAGPTLLIWLAILGIPGFLLWRRYRRIKAKF
jgi:flagellar motility protein MotE (MotC chaperone)